MAEKIESEDDFKKNVLESKVPVLVDFFAEWCGPCRIVSPTIDELSKNSDDKYKVFKVDVDKLPNLAVNYKINAIPTFLIFKEGVLAHTLHGIQEESVFKSLLV